MDNFFKRMHIYPDIDMNFDNIIEHFVFRLSLWTHKLNRMKVLMVCLGNICRSPLADGLLREKIRINKLDASVDSAGTSGHHAGEAPDPRMRTTAKAHDLSIDDLRARQFSRTDFDDFDLIYVMDESNYTNVTQLAKNEHEKNKVKLILNELTPGMNTAVPDPYYGGDQGFEDVFQMLDKATDIIIKKRLTND